MNFNHAARTRTKKLRQELKITLAGRDAAKANWDTAEAELAAAREAIKNLRDDAGERAAELSRAKTLAEDQKTSIDTFKEEVLQLEIQAAEMRGYISRVLEDDTVREVGGAKMPEIVMSSAEEDMHRSALREASEARRQPPRSVRLGPSSFRPFEIVGGWDRRDSDFTHVHRGAITTAPARPKHWTRR